MNFSASARNKILVTIFGTISLLFSYLIITNYNTSYNRSQEEALNYLYGIARTASIEIKGEEHDYIVRTYPNKDDIVDNKSSGLYYNIHKSLKKIHDINELNTSLYTMIYDSLTHSAYFIVASSDKPFYKHEYKSFTKDFVSNYNIGGKIKSYEDEHGKWLSAFAPIKNRNGKTVAVIQADIEFSPFLKELRVELIKEICISFVILTITLYLMYRFLNQVLVSQEKLNLALEAKNHEINQSIEYAKYIFDAAIVSPEEISKFVSNSFVFFRPKDVISGDFYVFYPITKTDGVCTKYAFGVFDCTGHGVSGAILSMLGLSIINHVMPLIHNHPPCHILSVLNKQFVKQMNQDNIAENNHAGMEGALCVVDVASKTVVFSGAKRSLYVYKKASGNLTVYKGDKHAIGQYEKDTVKDYNHEIISLSKGDNLYLFSDGISDQYITKNSESKKLKSKNFTNYLTSIQNISMQSQGSMLSQQFDEWKGDNEQTDDVTVMGVTI